MIHAGTRMYATIGPSRAALDAAGGLWLLSHGKLHHFGPDGIRREVADLAAIGAPPRPSDFDMHLDGRAVLADPDTSELVRCSLPQGSCERLPARLLTLPAQPILPLNAAKVHVDDAGGRYYVSDNAGGQVVAMDFSGEVKARTKPRVLHHPNQLALTGPDRLTVVNTDTHDLVTFDAGLTRVVDSMSTDAPGVARRFRVLPFDSVRLPDGGLAVLIAAPGMRDADLVRFDGDKPAWRADLGEDSDPFDVELWRGKLWVADATRYRFDAVTLGGTRAGTIEDAAFVAELGEAAKEPVKWKAIRRVSQIALVAFPLIGALLLWRIGRTGKAASPRPAGAFAGASTAAFDKAPALMPPSLAVRPVVLRRLRFLTQGAAWLSLALCVAVVGMMMWTAPLMFFEAGHRLRALGYAVLFLALGLLIFTVYRAIPSVYEQLHLAFDAKGVRYEAPGPFWPFGRGEKGGALWERVYADGTRLLVGSRLVTLKLPLFGSLFDEAGLAALLAALPEGHHVPSPRMNALAWRAGAFRKPLLALIAGVAAGLAVIALKRTLL